MNTPLLQKLREHLSSISKEEFLSEWAEIKGLGLEGPTMEEFTRSFSLSTNVAFTSPIEMVSANSDFEDFDLPDGTTNYAKAA